MRAILTWHSLDQSGSVVSTSPSLFERQIDTLLERGVRFVPLATLPFIPATEHTVALTFDDGFQNFATVAAPLLKSRGVTATVFVVTGLLGGTNCWDTGSQHRKIPALSLMDRDQVREVFEAGFDVGGHSVTHRPLSGLPTKLLEEEVKNCAAMIEAITGARPVTFAFPYGAHDEKSISLVARHFPVACTAVLARLNTASSPHALPRLDMHYFRSNGIVERWGTPLFQGYLLARSSCRRIRSALPGAAVQGRASHVPGR